MRYDRNRPLISEKDQEILASKRVAVLGLGGLGGYLAHGALRMGIKKLTLIDYDVFSTSNLNRQLFSSEENLGSYKADVLKDQLEKIDSQANIKIHKKRVQGLGDQALFKESDLILDGLDSANGRLILMDLAMKEGIPLVHGAISAFEGQVAFLEPDKNRMELIYPRDFKETKTNLAILPSFIASLQLNKMLKYFLFEEDLEKNVLFKYDLRYGDFYKILL